MHVYLIDDQGELWHGESRQMRAAFGSPFSGTEFVDFAVRNLGFVAINIHGASCQMRLRPSFAAPRALISFRNWLQQAKVERVVITIFEDGRQGGWQDELVCRAEADRRIRVLVQSRHSSAAWSTAGAPGIRSRAARHVWVACDRLSATQNGGAERQQASGQECRETRQCI